MFTSRLISSASRPTCRTNTLSRYYVKTNNEKQSSYFPCIVATRLFSADEKDSNRYPANAGPTLEEVRKAPLTIMHSSNETIVRLAADQNPEGCIEQLKRHVMIVESIEYPEACIIGDEIKSENSSINSALSLPNKIGVITATTGGFMSFPLTFHQPTVEWFNEKFVTADIPEPKDLETWLEVGAWSWNWMEPVMGQMSFLLLCLAFARSQFQTLGITPYSQRIKDERANALVEKFPMYDRKILSDFSKSQPFDWHAVKIIKAMWSKK